MNKNEYKKNVHFTDIQESLPAVTPKVLSKELKDLDQHQFISRSIIDDYLVKISYKLE